MAKTAVYKCKTCGDPFTARTADRKRGWARYCSKSCKARKQAGRDAKRLGVSLAKFRHYAREYGGMPEFDSRGEYVGFQSGAFDNTENQNKDRN